MVAARAVALLLFLVAPCVPPLVSSSGAQTSSPATASARMVHSFVDEGYEMLTTYLDDFALQLSGRSDLVPRIVVHSTADSPPGRGHRQLRTIRNYLVWYKDVDASRIQLEEGDLATRFTVELWMVETAAIDLPADSTRGSSERSTYLYDAQAVLDETSEIVPVEITTDLGLLDGYGRELRENPRARGVVIGYGRRDLRRSDRRVMLRLLRERKRYLIATHEIAADRVAIAFGGYRDGRELNLWVVPPEGVSPLDKPPFRGPTRRPSNRQSRRTHIDKQE